MTAKRKRNGIGRNFRATDPKALRRWINHYRQRREPPGASKGAPVGATSEEWQNYVEWVRAYGNDRSRRKGDIAETCDVNPGISYEAKRMDPWLKLDPANAQRLPQVAQPVFEAND